MRRGAMVGNWVVGGAGAEGVASELSRNAGREVECDWRSLFLDDRGIFILTWLLRNISDEPSCGIRSSVFNRHTLTYMHTLTHTHYCVHIEDSLKDLCAI